MERLGKYQLVRHLASGGMARVFLARVDGIGGFQRHVVLKCLRPERSEDQHYLTMFLDEARLVATLHHQHVAQVYEIGVADDGTHFLAMEFLHGETVRSVLERARNRRIRLPLDFALTVICAAAAGLHHAHERSASNGQPLGIVHRDVSPSNVIIGHDGAVKLIDFGIAMADQRSTRTQTGFIKGKAGYMAPEQALGYAVDRRSDVFSLGVVMYELTCQARAFRAASEYEAVQRIVKGEITPPTQLSSSYPPELEDVVMSALQVDPDDRFQDADAMRRAIELTANHLGISLGGSAVTRTMAELFGPAREPWLELPALDEPTESNDDAELLLTPPRPVRSTGPVGLARGSRPQLSQDDPTTRFMTVDDDRPAVIVSPVPARQLPPPVPPRMPSGSVPPPFAAEPPVTPTAVTLPVPLVTGPVHVTAPVPLAEILEPSRLVPRIPRSRTPLIAGAFVLGVLTIAVVTWTMRAPAAPAIEAAAPVTPTPPARAPAVDTPAPPAAAPSHAPISKTIAIEVTTDPGRAALMLDGKRLGYTPYSGTLPRGNKPLELKLRRTGHATETLEVTPDHDVIWNVTMQKR